MKRNYGIDLLRMVAMVFVIVLHITGVGGICANALPGTAQFYISQFLRMATFSAVNIYALISGYVGWNRTPKLSSLANLWLKVICFCVGITVFTQLRAPETVGLADLWKAFTPVTEAKYWYFNAYVGMFFFTPALNHAARNISGREAAFSAVGIGVISFTLIHTQFRDAFQLGSGYSALWLMILYLMGAFAARFDIPGKLSAGKWAALWLLAVCASFLSRMAMIAIKPELWSPGNYNLSMQYINPAVVLASAAMLGLFAKLKLPDWAVKVVKALSPHSFGVYLLHTNTLIFLTAIRNRFIWLATAPVWELLGVLLGVTVLIYALGTAADALVTRLFRLARIDTLLKKLP